MPDHCSLQTCFLTQISKAENTRDLDQHISLLSSLLPLSPHVHSIVAIRRFASHLLAQRTRSCHAHQLCLYSAAALAALTSFVSTSRRSLQTQARAHVTSITQKHALTDSLIAHRRSCLRKAMTSCPAPVSFSVLPIRHSSRL